jgi:hypothetical protein
MWRNGTRSKIREKIMVSHPGDAASGKVKPQAARAALPAPREKFAPRPAP